MVTRFLGSWWRSADNVFPPLRHMAVSRQHGRAGQYDVDDGTAPAVRCPTLDTGTLPVRPARLRGGRHLPSHPARPPAPLPALCARCARGRWASLRSWPSPPRRGSPIAVLESTVTVYE